MAFTQHREDASGHPSTRCLHIRARDDVSRARARLHAPRARRTRPHRLASRARTPPTAPRPSRRAGQRVASKPVAVDAKPSASKALLDEVRAALVPSGANAATVLARHNGFKRRTRPERTSRRRWPRLWDARLRGVRSATDVRVQDREKARTKRQDAARSWRRRRRCMIRA